MEQLSEHRNRSRNPLFTKGIHQTVPGNRSVELRTDTEPGRTDPTRREPIPDQPKKLSRTHDAREAAALEAAQPRAEPSEKGDGIPDDVKATFIDMGILKPQEPPVDKEALLAELKGRYPKPPGQPDAPT